MAQQNIHVWTGISNKTEEQFYKYFDQDKFLKDNHRFSTDESPEKDGPDLKLRCQFCKDLGLPSAYNEDWITMHFSRKKINVQLAIEELPVWDDQLEVDIYKACVAKGISTVNAIFSYADDTLTIDAPLKSYNDLMYVGCFVSQF
ncbi:immunity 22 family protein [Pedobacter cryoconitis]|uniref:Immunity protein 22 of polymorphic toxin system n=1 Tax=Pedobacter cryoconitis TaxID=188932 RepID=A0A7X0J4Q2_9SPHI|nr:immunity 22 family protein [Pedobacter cryoconitis]MBB6501025.1 hypothetical protein [Pedobacter cryoconitis]